ncbi:hypothetical protein [Prochlorococcus sp. MIT 0604]|nr:hypothetical protein [Prochlorococcus sp. MIT 0604]AIQ95888.1 hypothetical protein EW14_1881 [Prochlorococcus sp. MIT 0604]
MAIKPINPYVLKIESIAEIKEDNVYKLHFEKFLRSRYPEDISILNQ